MNSKHLHYEKAHLLAQMGKTDDAIAALRTCIEKGYLRQFLHVNHDRSMDAIRNHPAFTSLMEEYEAEKKALWAD